MERGPLSSALCAWAQAQGVWAGPPLLVAWAAARRQELPFGEHLARGTVLTFARRGGCVELAPLPLRCTTVACEGV